MSAAAEYQRRRRADLRASLGEEEYLRRQREQTNRYAAARREREAREPALREERLVKKRISVKTWQAKPAAKAYFRQWQRVWTAKPENRAKIRERVESLEARWAVIRRGASERGIEWRLSDPSDLARLCSSGSCYYCGIATGYAVDRVDPDGPYSIENCVQCCWICNRSKRTLTAARFVMCSAYVSRRRADGPSVRPPRGLFVACQPRSALACHFRAQAAGRGREIGIDEPTRQRLLHEPCRYCGLEPSLGIDRIDSARGYVEGNVDPCCMTCNFLKHEETLDDFYARCDRIRARWGSVVFGE